MNILNCPVCGNQPKKSSHNWEDMCCFSCSHENNHLCTSIWAPKKEAIKSWNKRIFRTGLICPFCGENLIEEIFGNGAYQYLCKCKQFRGAQGCKEEAIRTASKRSLNGFYIKK